MRLRNASSWLCGLLAVIGLCAIAYGVWLRPSSLPDIIERDGADVLAVAYKYRNGGGYSLTATGVPEHVIFKRAKILTAGKGTNCSGFTFAVAMRVAADRSLTLNLQPSQIRRFQQEWFGVSPGSQVKTLVQAMKDYGIGHEVSPLDARPGDFVQFWGEKQGHSVIFLDWIKRDGQIVGLRYRSSQPATNGVGDFNALFTTSGTSKGVILPGKFFVARLNG